MIQIRVKNALIQPLGLIHLSAAQTRYIGMLLLSWVVFLGFMTFYCYSQMLVINKPMYTSFAQAFQCVLKDWIVWLAVSPVLIQSAIKPGSERKIKQFAILGGLVSCVLIAAIYRIAVEYWIAGYSASDTFLLYFPRYLLASGLALLICHLHADKLTTTAKWEKQTNTSSMPTKAHDDKLLVYKGNKRVLIDIKSIQFINVSGNYLEINTENEHYLLRKTMKQMQCELDSNQFIRIHRSYLVNLSAVASVCPSKLEAELANGQTLRLGKKYLTAMPHFKNIVTK
ncbi:LytR/AlgR family response regulator transcription factor [Gayadomonas joobiniege]|uniref:LytR/AlgR family response regulator transcription factor n=1 Tax=Gayadomonas joobiniege TaxID=1234606 RepID=UPI000361A5A3|nr:LytTR family DNA-binding domain-containing protein [Gayadomonas joobiniege]